MEKLTPDNIVEKIKTLLEDEVISGQQEIADRTGFAPGSISNILSKTKPAGWRFVAVFSEAFSEELSTGKKKKSTEPPESLFLSEPQEQYKVTVFEKQQDIQNETMRLMAQTIKSQQETIERLTNELMRRNGEAGMSSDSPKVEAATG